MEWVVTTGRTVEEARETALDQLGVDEHDAEVEILREPQKGLFGRVRAEAQVRARVRPSAPPPKVDRRERRRRQRGREGERARPRARAGSRAGGRSAGGTGGGPGAGAADRDDVRSPSGGRDDGNRPDGREPAGGGTAAGQGSGQGAEKSRKRRRRSRRGGKAEGERVVSESATESPAAVGVAESDVEAQREAVEDFLRGLVEAFGRTDVSVSVTPTEDGALDAAIDGPELGLLVGQKGATLQSLQELVRSMVQRRFVGEAHARVRLDVAGYRERRRAALERFTVSVAEAVRESGVAKALDPMGAADRKVVHDAVNAIDGVETVSVGEDAYRHVVIRPSS